MLQDVSWWPSTSGTHTMGLEDLCCSWVHVPQVGLQGVPYLPLHPPSTPTFIRGCRGTPPARCSELPWASAGPHQHRASPSSSKHLSNFHQNYPDLICSSLPTVGTHRDLQPCQRGSGHAQPRRFTSPSASAQHWVQEIPSALSLPRTDLHIGSSECFQPLDFQGIILFMKLFAAPKSLAAVHLLLSRSLFPPFYSPLAVCLFFFKKKKKSFPWLYFQ